MSEYAISSLMAELNESAKTRSVVVSGIPTTSKDKIEIYFGKRVNGGGDIDQIIILDKSTALITFNETKVIKSVIEHGSHKLYGQTVEVTSLSSMLKKSKVTQPSNTDDVHKSKMSSYMKFLSVTEELTDSDKQRSLVVVGMPRIRHVTDQIETHFGKQKNGGGGIENIYLLDTDAALIIFCKENVVDSVIAKSPHQFHGSEVEAMSCDTYRLNNSDVTRDPQFRPIRVPKTLNEDVEGPRKCVEPFESVKVKISTKEHPHILDDKLSFLQRFSGKLEITLNEQKQFVKLKGDWKAIIEFREQMLVKAEGYGHTQPEERDASHEAMKTKKWLMNKTVGLPPEDDETRHRSRKYDDFKKEEKSTQTNSSLSQSHSSATRETYPNSASAPGNYHQTSSSNQPSQFTSPGTRNLHENIKEDYGYSSPRQPHSSATTETYPNSASAPGNYYRTSSANQPPYSSTYQVPYVQGYMYPPTNQAISNQAISHQPTPQQTYSDIARPPVSNQYPHHSTTVYYQSSTPASLIFNINNVKLTAKVGDITRESVDVIVSSIEVDVAMIGGLASAIVRAGGDRIKKECQDWYSQNKYTSTSGKVFAVGSGSLPCKKVVFLVMPICSVLASLKDNCKIMTRFCKQVLKLLKSIGATSVAIPGLGTGAFGYPISVFVKGMVTAIKDDLNYTTNLRNIILIDQNTLLLTELQTELGSGKWV